MGGPGLQQGAIYRKVFVAGQWLHFWGYQLLQEAPLNVVIEKPLADLGECGWVSDRIIWAEVQKLAE